jgi:hypothetical protein
MDEPVAWMCEANDWGTWKPSLCWVKSEDKFFRNWVPLYTSPLTCQQNRQVADHETICNLKVSAPPECQTEAEKTAYAFGWWQAWEQKKKWVGLTADEENEIAEDWWKDRLPDIHSVIKIIEAKLKEKNA